MRTGRKLVGNLMWYIILSCYGLIALFPFAWTVISSFKPEAEVMRFPPTFIPEKFHFDNFIKAWNMAGFTRLLLNSVFITGLSTMSVVFTSALAAYSMVIIKVRGSKLVLSLIMLGLILPAQTGFIPIFLLVKSLKLIDTYFGVIIPYLTSAFGLFMLHQFFQTIPLELIDAARIDGLGEIGIVTRIVMPLAKPGLLTLIICIFMNIWKDFFWPFLLLNSQEKRTIPVGIVAFWQMESPHYGIILAAAVMSMIPIIIIFATFQKQFIQGITFSGIKM